MRLRPEPDDAWPVAPQCVPGLSSTARRRYMWCFAFEFGGAGRLDPREPFFRAKQGQTIAEVTLVSRWSRD